MCQQKLNVTLIFPTSRMSQNKSIYFQMSVAFFKRLFIKISFRLQDIMADAGNKKQKTSHTPSNGKA